VLEKPNVPDADLLACLRDQYALHPTQIAFLPIGNDMHTAVYRVSTDEAISYFLKLRSGPFAAPTVALPRLLHDQGITAIIPPLPTHAGHLWTRLDAFAVILFPFVAGRNGFDVPLSEGQWVALGVALKRLHTAVVPPPLAAHLPHEMYGPQWRDQVRGWQACIAHTAFADPVAAQLAAFLRAKRDDISQIVARAEALGNVLRARPPAPVLCHADILAANVLLGADGALHIVDWDTLMFAPKERDLMFIGGGIGGIWNEAGEEALFYQGYGQTEINVQALAYYRYERIVEDIAEYCERLLLTDEGGADRAVGLGKFCGQFLPNHVVAIANRTDQLLGASQG
jgi:spectinomycin phosphotransferase